MEIKKYVRSTVGTYISQSQQHNLTISFFSKFQNFTAP